MRRADQNGIESRRVFLRARGMRMVKLSRVTRTSVSRIDALASEI